MYNAVSILSIVQVFDNEIPVFFLSNPPHLMAFSSEKSNDGGRDRPVGGRHTATLCVLVILSEMYGSLPLRRC